ncbi:hypothetical protein AB4Y64_10530 [Lysobacter sp. TAF61]|uniref:hypothetical protein n=1 Tax=Lysobacter sp. TAF61 TaxID=3233072 RepID=UPI003F9B880D
MKQSVVAALLLAGLLSPHAGFAQSIQCTLICNPPRMFCYPAGTIPPFNRICPQNLNGSAPAPATEPLLAPPSQSTAAPSACTAQPVFNEETQTYEWEMDCD